jgi:AraC family transcriptional regulator of adaptative response/methylated-DNA-[protein]-cysteine methyltransferase
MPCQSYVSHGEKISDIPTWIEIDRICGTQRKSEGKMRKFTMKDGVYDINANGLTFIASYPDVQCRGDRFLFGYYENGAYTWHGRFIVGNNGRPNKQNDPTAPQACSPHGMAPTSNKPTDPTSPPLPTRSLPGLRDRQCLEEHFTHERPIAGSTGIGIALPQIRGLHPREGNISLFIHRKNRVGTAKDSCEAWAMNDYERIAAAIRYLDGHREEQPDLATLAAWVGLSPSHFHRMFSAWAGATPKDFLQCLTLSHARDLLREGRNVLDTALESGLSGPGRLHDLCVSLEAATPGEIKARGAGMKIRAGVASSPFGHCLIAESPRGICHLSFFDEDEGAQAHEELRREWPLAEVTMDDAHIRSLASQVFTPGAVTRHWKLHVRGTAFQLRVWRALLEVPPGTLVSYGTLAAAVGNPNASRATGTAVGCNAISYLIPCHRVIRETGIPGNYRWGAVRKRVMLAWESGRAASP